MKCLSQPTLSLFPLSLHSWHIWTQREPQNNKGLTRQKIKKKQKISNFTQKFKK